MVINKKISIRNLGLMDYEPALALQEQLMADIISQKLHNRDHPATAVPTENYFLFVEHPHVYTLGKSGDEHNMLADEQFLKKINAKFLKTSRGGDITYHGFGQIIGYPVLDLDNFKTDIHLYMRNLEEVIIRTLADFGLKGERSTGETGVWLDVGLPYQRKICAMGVKTSKWVTMHGFALNVNTDLKYFEYIIPCGIRGKAVTSMQRELGTIFSEEETLKIQRKILHYFSEVFDAEIV